MLQQLCYFSVRTLGINFVDTLTCQATKSRVITLRDLGCINYFLGIEVSYVNGVVHLNQQKYIQDVLTRSTMQDLKSISTHGVAGTNLSQFAGDTFSKTSLCHSIVGALQYVTITRQDISYAINKVCLFMAYPTPVHWITLKRILWHLKGTPSLGLIFHPSTSLDIQVYTDTNQASCLDDRRSTIGYCIFLGSNLVSLSSTKQRTISRRSSEFEYCALVAIVAEITWIQFVFQELCISIRSPPLMWCDNQNATQLVANLVFHARSKHIKIDLHFIRDKVLQ